MPTGYTAGVGAGTIKEFRDFALLCARAFGACIMQRDDPMADPPKEHPIDSHSAERVAKQRAEYDRIAAMSDDEAEAAAAEMYEKAVAERERQIAENRETEARYNAMLAEVRLWKPPTPEHQGLRDFMEKQLIDSINWDCRYEPSVPERLTGRVWKATRLKLAADSMASYAKYHAEEVERSNSRNQWIRDLYASLESSGARS